VLPGAETLRAPKMCERYLVKNMISSIIKIIRKLKIEENIKRENKQVSFMRLLHLPIQHDH